MRSRSSTPSTSSARSSSSDSPSRSHRPRSSRRSGKRSYALATLSILAAAIGFSRPVVADDSSFPSIDFDALGAVGVAGNFAGLQVWSQSSSSLNPANVYNPSASTIIERSSNGTLTQLNSTEDGGAIKALCSRSTGALFFGGNFSKIAGLDASNVASYDPQTKAWENLDGGLDGRVDAMLCMEEIVVVGGNFTAPKAVTNAADSRYFGAVAAWNYTAKAWQSLDLGGFNGTVRTIVAGTNASSVQFGGSFDTEPGDSGNLTAPTSGTNTSATALSAKFAPVSMAMSLFEGGPASSDASFSMAPQLICPKGDDGAGNTYLFEDNSAGYLRVSLFQKVWARAFRLGNTFYEGRGVQNFSISALPSGDTLELLYLDPATNKNVTCTTNCQMYHDASIPYQDFLITNATGNDATNGTKVMSGFMFNVSTWYGDGAGLHIMQVLSDGGWSHAYKSYNRDSCNSPVLGVNGTGSDTSSSGGWSHSLIDTQWSGVPAGIMSLSDSYSNIGDYSDAQVSFNVDLAVNGNYTGYLHVPGCQRSGDCDERTDVLVTVINNSSNPGTSVRVSQNVNDDTSVLIWDGEVDATSQDFMPSVVLSVPSDATRPSSGTFTAIADRVRFVLQNSNQTAQPPKDAKGFGVLEYDILDPEQRALTTVNGTGVIPGSRLTDLSAFGVTLLKQGVQRNQSEYVTSIATAKGYTFVGGAFQSTNFTASKGFKNIVAYETNQNASLGVNYTRLASGGLNGTVTALAVIDDMLFVGGAFTGLADSSASARYVARYDPEGKAWAALANGPDGPITSMSTIGSDGLLVSGNFTTIAGTTSAGGYAVWNTSTDAWESQSELLVGQISSVSVFNETAYMVGSIEGVSGNAASGVAGVEPPSEDGNPPQIQMLNFNFLSSGQGSTPTSSNTSSRRSLPAERVSQRRADVFAGSSDASVASAPRQERRSTFGKLLSAMVSREDKSSVASSSAQHLIRRADAMEPASLQGDGDNEVLASAFWEQSDGTYVTIIGGNFTTTTGIKNLALYDPSNSTLYAFPAYPSEDDGDKPTVFRALAVVYDILYAGGDGGLVTFDLANNQWVTTGQTLAVSDGGTNLTVTAISHRPDTTNVLVAGAFDSAGMLPCNNVCLWDTSSERWTPLGSGISGQIATIDFAGSKASNLIVAGDLSVNGAEAALASWDFNAQNWSPLGSVGSGSDQAPGPATAASVDDLSMDAIFVAGRTSDGTGPYLARWDGSSYTVMQSSELNQDTGIAQLTFVPITKAHSSNSVLENNRLLVVSGALKMQSYGNVSSAFFDGENWTPFLVTTSASGGPGVVRTFSRSTEVLKFPNLHHLAVGLVILISIAIGLGIVFLLVLIGLLIALARRRPNRGVDVPISPSDEALAAEKKRPSSLLATLNAATENVMGAGAVGAGAGAAAAATSSGHGRGESVPITSEGHGYSDPSSQYHSDAPTGQYYSGESGHSHGALAAGAGAAAAGAAGAAATNDDGDSEGIEAHMRFSFEASHPSELAVRAGEAVTILDDDDEHWWLARSEDGRVGVVPASYVL